MSSLAQAGRSGKTFGPGVRKQTTRTGLLAFMACILAFTGPATSAAEPKAPEVVAAAPADDAKAINMEFRDTDLTTVLRTLCEVGGVDFVLAPSVDGRVTAKLRNTSWKRALEIILSSQGLSAKRQGDTLLVARAHPENAAAAEQRVVVTARGDGTLDFDARAADIHAALRELADVTNMNIVGSKDISGSVTAALHGLRAEEILLALADCVGAAVTNKGSVMFLTPRTNDDGAAAGAADNAIGPGSLAAVEVKKLPNGRVSIHAKGASVRSVLAALATASGINIIVSPRLSGSVTLDPEDVTTDDALAAVAVLANMVIRPVGGALLAAPAPPAVQTEIFRLRNAAAEEVGKVISASFEGVTVAVEPANNLLIVTGSPDMIAAARQIVKRVEIPPTQVTIEVRILETNLTENEKVGIDWSNSIGIDATTPVIPHSWPLSRRTSSRFAPGYDPSDDLSRGNKAVPFADPGDFQFGFLSSTGLSMVLHMLQEKTSTSMIANPTITTVENNEAKISIVTKFPIAQYQVSSETGVLNVSGFEYKEFGTILTVTARVADGHIMLDVHPEVSRQAGVTLFQGAELPILQSQETRTRVRIKDGDTLVIAGLIREDTQTREGGVPILRHIPLLGALFRWKNNSIEQKRNLLIFLTPHIVGDEDFARAAELKKERTVPADKVINVGEAAADNTEEQK